MSVSSIVMPDEQYAISELRTLRFKTEKHGKEIAKELRMWQDSLGHGKFKKNYLLAGWTENKVIHYLSYYHEDADGDSHPNVIESKETNRSEIQWLIYRMTGITATIEQVLTKDKWQKDKDFPELQQMSKALISLLERL